MTLQINFCSVKIQLSSDFLGVYAECVKEKIEITEEHSNWHRFECQDFFMLTAKKIQEAEKKLTPEYTIIPRVRLRPVCRCLSIRTWRCFRWTNIQERLLPPAY